MKKVLFYWLSLGVIFQLQAQTDPLTQTHGARSQGMGNLRVHNNDLWTVFNNIGGLDRVENSGIAVGYDQRYNLKELGTFSLALANKTSLGTFGFSVSRFGSSLFSQQSIGLGFSQTLGIASLGAKLEWFQTQIEGFGNSGVPVISLGGVAELSPDFYLGAHFSNLTRSKISSLSDSRLPSSIQLGARYSPSEYLNLILEVEKDILLDPVTKIGVEYSLKRWIQLRLGVNSNPSRLFFGFGLIHESFRFDYSRGRNQALGSTNHFSLAYVFQ